MSPAPRGRTGGLGRGLGALIPEAANQQRRTEVSIAQIARNPFQPRLRMEQQDLERLAASIAEHGVLQPVVLTERDDGRYELVAGERRVRAAELAGLDRVPAVVRTVTEREQLALALVENLQRADLNAIEEARAFRQLIDEFGLTHEEIGSRVARSRSTVANTLRLLELSPNVQTAVQEGAISEGHARAIGGLGDPARQDDLLAAVVGRGLSVRQTEEVVRRLREMPAPITRSRTTARESELDRIESALREALGTKVTVASARKGGRITIEYYDSDDLTRLYERLTGAPA